MIDKITNKILIRARKKMPEIDDERAEVIKFGLELLIGEIPKILLLFLISYVLGILRYTVAAFIIVSPYRTFSGGIHLKTHMGCMLGTTIFYCGIAYSSYIINLNDHYMHSLFAVLVWVYSIVMISIYAPADTQNIPILRKKDRKRKKILSYMIVTLMVISSFVVNNQVITNMLIIGSFAQSSTITGLAYKIFSLKYGYREQLRERKNAS